MTLPDTHLPLSDDDAEAVFGSILDGEIPDADVAAFLVSLSERGETAGEITGAARAMRQRMVAITAPQNAIDVCGTGGDGHHTLNVSTAVSLVVAAAGVPVAKHGNRAASSLAGSADTLEALGMDLDLAAETAQSTLGDIGICFLFAAHHHPALGRLMPLRKAIGRRTIFNLLGPLANPASVSRQLVGIARPAYVSIFADALQRLGTTNSMVISGDEGLDELSISGGNDVAYLSDGSLTMGRIAPADAGLSLAPIEAIRGGDAAYNAFSLVELLDGKPGAYRDAVLLNAAGGLLVAGEARSWADGAARAAQIIDEGMARSLLNRWIAITSK